LSKSVDEAAGGIRPWLILALIGCAAAVAQAFGRFSFGVLYPAIRDDLSVSNTIAALLGASNVGMYLVGTMVVAWTTSRISLLNTFRMGLVLSTTGLGFAAFADAPAQLALGLAIAGFGGACVWIPAPAIAADAMPDRHRNIAVGLMGSGIGAGIVFVSLLTAKLRASMGDAAWSGVYEVQAGFALLVLIAVFFIVRHAQELTAGRRGAGGLGALRRMKGWMPLIVAYSIFGFMYLLVIGFLTSRLEDDSNWASTDAAYAFTLMGVAMIFGAPLFVAMANRTGARRALCLAFLLWPVLVMIVLSGVPAVTLPAVVGLGLLFSALPSLITVYVVQNTASSDYGPTFAVATLAFGIAQVVSPPVGGLIADLSGSFTLVFVLSALMGAGGFFAVLRLPSD
jgi:predicted MFS family arabinose efflux permease